MTGARRAGTTPNVSRVPMAKLAPMALAMKERGWTIPVIAKKLKRSERYVSLLLAHARKQGSSMIVEIPDPMKVSELPEELRALVEFTADAFEEFFNRYSRQTLSPIHKQWVEQALSTNRTLINCPPRHAKSEIFSVWFPVWLTCMDRNVQILICSETDQLAKKMTNKIAHQLTSNAKLITDFGRFKPEMADWPWRPNTGYLMVEGRDRDAESGDPTIQVRGAKQQILGMEANWVIVDDPVSRGMSQPERERMSEWFHGDVMSRLEPEGRAIVVGQRLHIHDLYGELSKEKTSYKDSSKSWNHINYPAIADWETKTVLWPEKWGWDELMQVYQDVGKDIFESMYQQNPLPEGRRLARKEWLYGDDNHAGCIDSTRNLGYGLRELSGAGGTPALGAEVVPADKIVRVLSIDPSPTRFAGLIVADVPRLDTHFQAYIIEVTREKMSVRDMVQHIDRCIEIYRPDYFIFEQVAAQRWFLQDSAMDRIKQQLTVLPHTTGRNKGDATLGVESLAVDFEFGRLRFPYGDAESKNMSELLFEEARTYPQGYTDDLLMALWFIKFNYQRLIPRGIAGGWAGKGFVAPPRLSGGWGWHKAASAKQRSQTEWSKQTRAV